MGRKAGRTLRGQDQRENHDRLTFKPGLIRNCSWEPSYASRWAGQEAGGAGQEVSARALVWKEPE